MKSVIFSFFLIIIVIITIIFSSHYTADTEEAMTTIADKFYIADSIPENLSILSELRGEWSKRKRVLACIIPHDIVQLVDETLSELEVFISNDARIEAMSSIARLKVYISSFASGEAPTLQNVL